MALPAGLAQERTRAARASSSSKPNIFPRIDSSNSATRASSLRQHNDFVFVYVPPQYVLVLEEGDHFLLAGRKRKSGAQGAEYTISVGASAA